MTNIVKIGQFQIPARMQMKKQTPTRHVQYHINFGEILVKSYSDL